MSKQAAEYFYGCLQEECAEVIQAISKIRRFGPSKTRKGKNKTTKEEFVEEVGQVFVLVAKLAEIGFIAEDDLIKSIETASTKEYYKG